MNMRSWRSARVGPPLLRLLVLVGCLIGCLTSTPTLSPTEGPDLECFITDCGCPDGGYDQEWCNIANAAMTNPYCHRSEYACDGCSGVWCGGSAAPTPLPSGSPSELPSPLPTLGPSLTLRPTPAAPPTSAPTAVPTAATTPGPSSAPTAAPTRGPTLAPTHAPSPLPTSSDTVAVAVRVALGASSASPTAGQAAELREVVVTQLGLGDAAVKGFTVKGFAVATDRVAVSAAAVGLLRSRQEPQPQPHHHQRRSSAYAWSMSFSVVASLATAGAADAFNLASQVSGNLEDPSFTAAVAAGVNAVALSVEDVAAYPATRAPTQSPAARPDGSGGGGGEGESSGGFKAALGPELVVGLVALAAVGGLLYVGYVLSKEETKRPVWDSEGGWVNVAVASNALHAAGGREREPPVDLDDYSAPQGGGGRGGRRGGGRGGGGKRGGGGGGLSPHHDPWGSGVARTVELTGSGLGLAGSPLGGRVPNLNAGFDVIDGGRAAAGSGARGDGGGGSGGGKGAGAPLKTIDGDEGSGGGRSRGTSVLQRTVDIDDLLDAEDDGGLRFLKRGGPGSTTFSFAERVQAKAAKAKEQQQQHPAPGQLQRRRSSLGSRYSFSGGAAGGGGASSSSSSAADRELGELLRSAGLAPFHPTLVALGIGSVGDLADPDIVTDADLISEVGMGKGHVRALRSELLRRGFLGGILGGGGGGGSGSGSGAGGGGSSVVRGVAAKESAAAGAAAKEAANGPFLLIC